MTVLTPHAPGAARYERWNGVEVKRFRYVLPVRWEQLVGGGATMKNLEAKPWLWTLVPLLLVAMTTSLDRELRRGRYDVVHSHWIVPQGAVASLVAARRRMPHVATVHGGDVFQLKSRLLSSVKAWTIRRAETVTANSSATMAEVSDLWPEAKAVLLPVGIVERTPNVLLAQAIREQYQGSPLAVFVGRLVAEKGVDDFLEALSLATTSLPHLVGLVVGEGQERARLESKARELGLADAVSFVGWVQPQDVPSYLAAADVFVGPSRSSGQAWREAQGLVFGEAMAVGVPVVATRTGGIADHVTHEVTGLIVSERAPQQIADAIVRLHGDPQLRDRIRDAAKAHVESSLTMSQMASRLEEVYQQSARGRRSAL